MLGFVYVIKQYERGVQFRLGRVRDGGRGPGVIFVVPLVDRVRRVSLRIVTLPIESQGIITRDNVSVGVSAVAYYRVEDAVRSIVAIENVSAAINPGNSGGALVDLSGQVIGIPTLAAVDPEMGAEAPGIGFAIDSNTVRRVADTLVRSG